MGTRYRLYYRTFDRKTRNVLHFISVPFVPSMFIQILPICVSNVYTDIRIIICYTSYDVARPCDLLPYLNVYYPSADDIIYIILY